jgi:hypothetical protein
MSSSAQDRMAFAVERLRKRNIEAHLVEDNIIETALNHFEGIAKRAMSRKRHAKRSIAARNSGPSGSQTVVLAKRQPKWPGFIVDIAQKIAGVITNSILGMLGSAGDEGSGKANLAPTGGKWSQEAGQVVNSFAEDFSKMTPKDYKYLLTDAEFLLQNQLDGAASKNSNSPANLALNAVHMGQAAFAVAEKNNLLDGNTDLMSLLIKALAGGMSSSAKSPSTTSPAPVSAESPSESTPQSSSNGIRSVAPEGSLKIGELGNIAALPSVPLSSITQQAPQQTVTEPAAEAPISSQQQQQQQQQQMPAPATLPPVNTPASNELPSTTSPLGMTASPPLVA